jgi:hypothetical protein
MSGDVSISESWEYGRFEKEKMTQYYIILYETDLVAEPKRPSLRLHKS